MASFRRIIPLRSPLISTRFLRCRSCNASLSEKVKGELELKEEEQVLEANNMVPVDEIAKIRLEFDEAKKSFLSIPKVLKDMPKMNPEDIYVNKNLRLDNIQVYGFDYDYTLAQYSANLQSLIYNPAKEHLVNELSRKKIEEIYCTRHIGRDQARALVALMDFFCLSVACLIADIVQHFVDAKLDFDAGYVCQDVNREIQHVHRSGLVHRGNLSDPQRYLVKNGELLSLLRMLREKGKKLVLLNNSPFYFVDGGMRFMLEDSLGTQDSSRELFDVVIAKANKTEFYTSQHQFHTDEHQKGGQKQIHNARGSTRIPNSRNISTFTKDCTKAINWRAPWDVLVQNQNDYPLCEAYASATILEFYQYIGKGYVGNDACPHIKELIAQKRSRPPPKTSYSDINEWQLLEDTEILTVNAEYNSRLLKGYLRSHPAIIKIKIGSTFDELGYKEVYYGPKTKDEMLVGHTMVVVGYFGDQLIVQNSWGIDWGLYGYGYINIHAPKIERITLVNQPKHCVIKPRIGNDAILFDNHLRMLWEKSQ